MKQWDRVAAAKQAIRLVVVDWSYANGMAANKTDPNLPNAPDAGESAKSLDRPGLQRALGMLKAGEAEALLVVKLDRLTRSVVDLGTLVERYFAPGKAALLSVGEQIDTRSAAARLVLNVLASVSQWVPSPASASTTCRRTPHCRSSCAAALRSGASSPAAWAIACASNGHVQELVLEPEDVA